MSSLALCLIGEDSYLVEAPFNAVICSLARMMPLLPLMVLGSPLVVAVDVAGAMLVWWLLGSSKSPALGDSCHLPLCCSAVAVPIAVYSAVYAVLLPWICCRRSVRKALSIVVSVCFVREVPCRCHTMWPINRP